MEFKNGPEKPKRPVTTKGAHKMQLKTQLSPNYASKKQLQANDDKTPMLVPLQVA